MDKYYKVVQRLNNGDRVSAVISKNTGLRETYISHGKAKTVNYGMVFSDASSAAFFAKVESSEQKIQEVWECSVGNTEKVRRIIDVSDLLFFGKECKKVFYGILGVLRGSGARWLLNGDEKLKIYTVYPPPDSYLAQNITLQKKLIEFTSGVEQCYNTTK